MHRRTASQRHQNPSGMPSPLVPYLPSLASLNPPSTTDPTSFVGIFEFFHPRKSRQRATFLCLVSLVIITTYICLVSPPALSPGYDHGPHRMKLAYAEDTWRKLAAKLPGTPGGHVYQHRPDILLSPEQELGAVTAFMAALPQNVIPTDIDPAEPIDPQLVLDFDTRGPYALEEVADVVTDVWTRNPLVVFSKVTSPFHFATYTFVTFGWPHW